MYIQTEDVTNVMFGHGFHGPQKTEIEDYEGMWNDH
jgi:hypothetical protein